MATLSKKKVKEENKALVFNATELKRIQRNPKFGFQTLGSNLRKRSKLELSLSNICTANNSERDNLKTCNVQSFKALFLFKFGAFANYTFDSRRAVLRVEGFFSEESSLKILHRNFFTGASSQRSIAEMLEHHVHRLSKRSKLLNELSNVATF